MTATNFLTPALPFTLGEEGGFIDDPKDPGGATNLGVDLATWRHWKRDQTLGVPAIRALTVATVTPLYASRFWQGHGCDNLPAGLDLTVFDATVNTGSHGAMQLQEIVGLKHDDVDGWIGQQTLDALAHVNAGHLGLTMGPTGARLFQAALGLAQDGRVGKITLSAMAARPDATLVCAMADAAETYYRGLAGYAHDGKGWIARVSRRTASACKLALAA